MRKFVIVIFLFCAGFLFAQTSYKHITNTVECVLVDNGIIGDDASGTYGGLKYLGGSNVIYSGGLVTVLVPQTGPANAYGMCGSYDMADFTNSSPFSGFTSNANFDTIGNYVFSGLGAYGTVVSYSKNDQSVIYLREIGSNPNAEPTLPSYAGVIIDFDIGPGNNYSTNSGGYDPARNLVYMFDATPGTPDTNYYGLVVLNVPPNTMRAKLIQNYSATTQDVANYLMNTDFSDPGIADHRMHISTPSGPIPPGGEVEHYFAIVCGTSLADLQNNVDNAAIPSGSLIPVELTSFTAELKSNQVILKWTTATELNNHGFEIQRKVSSGEFSTVGFIEGNGTSTHQRDYIYVDKDIDDGSYAYRLKQVDFNGTFGYSDVVNVEIITPEKFRLEQNYPNPFNPATTIGYALQEKSYTKLTVINSLGEEVAILVNEIQDKGYHTIDFNANNLSSGVYFYKIQSGNFVGTKKMLLLK